MTMARVLLLLLLLGCGESHTTDNDAGTRLDAGRGDAGTFPDAVAPDAGFDAGAIVPTSCSGELDAMDGEPCFCQGAIAIEGDVAYRIGYELEVYDISDEVVRTGTTPQSRPGAEGAIVLNGDTLFVGDWGLEVFDVSERMRPRSIAVTDVEGTISDFAIVGSTLWMGIDDGEVGWLRSYNVSDPTNPREMATLRLDGNPGSVLSWSDRIVVLEKRRFGDDGMDTATIVDVSAAPRVDARIDLMDRAVLRRRGAIAGDTLFVAGTTQLLQVVDLAARRMLTTLEAPDGGSGTGLGITVSNSLAFVSGLQIRVADVSEPGAPRWIGRLNAPNDVHHVVRQGETLFIGTGGYLGRIPLDCR